MGRKYFLKKGLILGGATLLPTASAFAQNLTANGNHLVWKSLIHLETDFCLVKSQNK